MKHWYQSRTIIFNIVMAMMIALEASLHQLSAIIPANWYGIMATFLAVGNAALRVISSSEITK